jgi:hypothetical protein
VATPLKNRSDSTEKSQKDESTRKSSPSDSTRRSRVSKAPKEKSEARKRSAAAKKGAQTKKRKSGGEGKSTPSGPRVPINTHGFPPETKVEVYRAVDVDVQRRENRPPVGEVVTTATVSKAGDLNIQRSKLEPGQYVAVAKVDEPPQNVVNRIEGEDTYIYTGFGVVTDEQRDKFGSMTGLFGGKKS